METSFMLGMDIHVHHLLRLSRKEKKKKEGYANITDGMKNLVD